MFDYLENPKVRTECRGVAVTVFARRLPLPRLLNPPRPPLTPLL